MQQKLFEVHMTVNNTDCLRNRFHFSLRLYSYSYTDDVKIWWEQNEREVLVKCVTFVLTTFWHLLCIYKSTDAQKNGIYLFYIIVRCRFLSKRERAKRSKWPLWRHSCVCSLITHISQPIIALVISQLLYNAKWLIDWLINITERRWWRKWWTRNGRRYRDTITWCYELKLLLWTSWYWIEQRRDV